MRKNSVYTLHPGFAMEERLKERTGDKEVAKWLKHAYEMDV